MPTCAWPLSIFPRGRASKVAGALSVHARKALAIGGALSGGVALAACAPQPNAAPALPAHPVRIVSLDYCADQYLLKLMPRDRIAALSPDAAKPFSYMRRAAIGLPTVRVTAEDVLALRPDLIVRSYGGGANAAALFERAGVPVLQIAFVDDIASVRQSMHDVSQALGEPEKGAAITAEMDRRLANLPPAPAHRPTALYVTPGGVTTGVGGLVDEMMTRAGYANFQTEPGWRSLPLEQLALRQPDVIARASFGDDRPGEWSSARHPVLARAERHARNVPIEGAWTACGGWFVLDAIEALGEARMP